MKSHCIEIESNQIYQITFNHIMLYHEYLYLYVMMIRKEQHDYMCAPRPWPQAPMGLNGINMSE